MKNEFLTFEINIEIEKHKFRFSKCPVDTKNIGIDKIMISHKVLNTSDQKGFKYFIGYQNRDRV